MRINYLITSIAFTVIILAINQTVTAQSSNSTIAKVISEKYTKSYTYDPTTDTSYSEPQLLRTVQVKYESPSTVLISGELINHPINAFNSQLWEAMDLLKNQYGFKFQNVMTSGVGSVENPTTVYILMTK
jgi:hypothetical protein